MNLKSLSHSIISFLVVFSLLVPSIAPFMECNNDFLISLEFDEKESKKEHKKELDEKEVYFQETTDNEQLAELTSQTLSNRYLVTFFEVDQEIFLPPPEHNA